MKFNIGDVKLSRADLHYNDVFYGQDFAVSFKSIDLGVDKFNLDSMAFKLDHLYTENLKAAISFKPTKNIVSKDTSTSGTGPMPLIVGDSILLTGTTILYADEKGAMDLNTVAAKLGLSGLTFNLKHQPGKT